MSKPTVRSYEIRPAVAEDEAFLWESLAYAAYADDADDARATPAVAKWLHGWPWDNDFGVVATMDDRSVGGAWARMFPGPDPSLAIYIDDKTPEIAIGVDPAFRGRGIGEALLDALILEARTRGWHGLCLTVRSTNPAVNLYRRKGFAFVPEAERINRVGGVSYGMVLRF